MESRRYDPTWVVELAKAQYPDDGRLHSALAECTTVIRFCDCGCGTPYFVGVEPDDAGERSDFGIRLSLEREDGSAVIVDLLPDGRVACIEG